MNGMRAAGTRTNCDNLQNQSLENQADSKRGERIERVANRSADRHDGDSIKRMQNEEANFPYSDHRGAL